jgi:hypothetical protein
VTVKRRRIKSLKMDKEQKWIFLVNAHLQALKLSWLVEHPDVDMDSSVVCDVCLQLVGQVTDTIRDNRIGERVECADPSWPIPRLPPQFILS